MHIRGIPYVYVYETYINESVICDSCDSWLKYEKQPVTNPSQTRHNPSFRGLVNRQRILVRCIFAPNSVLLNGQICPLDPRRTQNRSLGIYIKGWTHPSIDGCGENSPPVSKLLQIWSGLRCECNVHISRNEFCNGWRSYLY